MRISLERLFSRESKILETIDEINKNELSMSNDQPVDVSYNPENNVYVLMNGHHRVVEAYLAGKKSIEGLRNEYVPTTYDLDLDNNVNLMDVVRKAESQNKFKEDTDVTLINDFLSEKKAKKEKELKKSQKSKRKNKM